MVAQALFYSRNAMGEIFMKLKKYSVNLLSACFTMKEGGNNKTYGSIVIPKARGVRTSLFCVSTPKEKERKYEL